MTSFRFPASCCFSVQQYAVAARFAAVLVFMSVVCLTSPVIAAVPGGVQDDAAVAEDGDPARGLIPAEWAYRVAGFRLHNVRSTDIDWLLQIGDFDAGNIDDPEKLVQRWDRGGTYYDGFIFGVGDPSSNDFGVLYINQLMRSGIDNSLETLPTSNREMTFPWDRRLPIQFAGFRPRFFWYGTPSSVTISTDQDEDRLVQGMRNTLRSDFAILFNNVDELLEQPSYRPHRENPDHLRRAFDDGTMTGSFAQYRTAGGSLATMVVRQPRDDRRGPEWDHLPARDVTFIRMQEDGMSSVLRLKLWELEDDHVFMMPQLPEDFPDAHKGLVEWYPANATFYDRSEVAPWSRTDVRAVYGRDGQIGMSSDSSVPARPWPFYIVVALSTLLATYLFKPVRRAS